MSAGQNRLVQKRLKLKRRGYDGVADEQIFDRDNWQCQLPECLHPEDEGGRAIDPALRGLPAGWWTPAIHHIKRLADGGLSNAANKLAAHNRCSSVAHRETQQRDALRDQREKALTRIAEIDAQLREQEPDLG